MSYNRHARGLGAAAAVALTIGLTLALVQPGDGRGHEPLVIAEQGSFFAGGQLVHSPAN